MCFRPAAVGSDVTCPECGANCGMFDSVCPECGADLPSNGGGAPGMPGMPGA